MQSDCDSKKSEQHALKQLGQQLKARYKELIGVSDTKVHSGWSESSADSARLIVSGIESARNKSNSKANETNVRT
jgi:hypothetical protein